MNAFQSTQSGAGLLKIDYDDDDEPVSRALKKRADKLKDKIVVPTKEDLEQTDTEE